MVWRPGSKAPQELSKKLPLRDNRAGWAILLYPFTHSRGSFAAPHCSPRRVRVSCDINECSGEAGEQSMSQSSHPLPHALGCMQPRNPARAAALRPPQINKFSLLFLLPVPGLAACRCAPSADSHPGPGSLSRPSIQRRPNP
jgi:hypothetical protein